MNTTVQSLKAFLGQTGRVALVEVAATKGSTPREKGAFMLVSQAATSGTIGGGQLEYMAIDKARQMLGSLPSSLRGGSASGRREAASAKRGGGAAFTDPSTTTSSNPIQKGEGEETRPDAHVILDVALGPEIGQCCGGRVEVSIRLVDATLAQELISAAEIEQAELPYVYIFGGGHVGQALASAVALLPVRAVVIETRADALDGMPEAVETRLTPMPEAEVRNAPAGSAFAILTHDHALDFLIVAEALKRGDTAYVGMIGSKTKKATFRNWLLKSAEGTEAQFARLVSPIGGDAVKDKRPSVIAALAAAEIMTALVNHGAASNAGRQMPHDRTLAG
ncbi:MULTISPECIES: xanthine dehydrogenase accessory protein XdhC [unclassified Mesorhizobium]|uniref:xanthine dehydrogenase accessory protein XdhC n=1 Tax=unclassified Mesorhizobium TaxID=325217 RepID=UPI0011284124|nr:MULTISPECIES: xanthine dehydrogenase accessory protein XdhC [unclassified Mesorhizobium]TPL10692.1 xanthine dehydrogenase accessory protein XdhC [Mesorhizobium sp. B2-4-10]TPM12602.1 xanthine dehydrogenase accessory protein XdhC [Mesorhizobium sp. B2-3-6]